MEEFGLAPRRCTLKDAREGELIDCYARILAIYAPKGFERFGKRRELCRVDVSDGSATTALLLWGANAQLARRLRRGDAIEIRGAVVKRALQGGIELHTTAPTQLRKLSEEEAQAASLPVPRFELKRLADASMGGEIDCAVRLVDVSTVKVFERAGRRDVMTRALVCDSSACMPLIAWGGNATLLASMKAGDGVVFEGAVAKQNLSTMRLELHAGWRCHIAPCNDVPPLDELLPLALPRKKLSELDERLALVECSVKEVAFSREFLTCAHCGARLLEVSEGCCSEKIVQKRLMASLTICDETREMRATCWGSSVQALVDAKAPIEVVAQLRKNALSGEDEALVVAVVKQE